LSRSAIRINLLDIQIKDLQLTLAEIGKKQKPQQRQSKSDNRANG